MVAQVGISLEALPSSMVTLSPSCSVSTIEALCGNVKSGMLNHWQNAYGIACRFFLRGSGSLLGLLCGGRRFSGRFGCRRLQAVRPRQHQCRQSVWRECLFHGFFLLKIKFSKI